MLFSGKGRKGKPTNKSREKYNDHRFKPGSRSMCKGKGSGKVFRSNEGYYLIATPRASSLERDISAHPDFWYC